MARINRIAFACVLLIGLCACVGGNLERVETKTRTPDPAPLTYQGAYDAAPGDTNEKHRAATAYCLNNPCIWG